MPLRRAPRIGGRLFVGIFALNEDPVLVALRMRLRALGVGLAAIAGIALCAAAGGETQARGEDLPMPAALFASPNFLPRAHSHNDYEQLHPCSDAIAARVSSIEADLWLEGEKVLVGHDRGKWRGDLESLYLKPLNALWERDALPVGPDGVFLLWLDLKDASPGLRSRLHELLEAYPFTKARDERHQAVQVILTGNAVAKESFVTEYPSAVVTRDSNTFSEEDPEGTPAWSWYAVNWKTVAGGDGKTEITPEQREKLRAVVAKVHAKGRKLRLWNHPAGLEFWEMATAAGVDRLGTDRLPGGK